MSLEQQSGSIPLEKFNTPDEEIKYLREQVAVDEKVSDASEERSPFQIKAKIENYQDIPKENLLSEKMQISDNHAEEIALELSPEEHDNKMAELLQLLQSKGVHNTLSIVSKMNDPHVEDDFHRFLVAYLHGGYSIKDLKEKMPLARELNHVLYEIQLPEYSDDDKKKPIDELLNSMQQLFSGLSAISNNTRSDSVGETFVFEIAFAEGSKEYIFYASVPVQSGDLFEKQLLSLYPSAILSKHPDDFNIFRSDSVVSASVAKLSNHGAYPLKTYEDFSDDPMNVILNSFSKLEQHGEGVALQLVCNSVGDSINTTYKNKIQKLQEGKDVKEVLDKEMSAGKTLALNLAKDAVGIIFNTQDKKKEEEEKKPDASLNQRIIDQIARKVETPILTANLRIVTSALTGIRANSIRREIESGFRQFENGAGNALVFEEVTGKKMNKMLHDFSFRSFNPNTSIPLSIKELSTIFHFPISSMQVAPQAKRAQSKTVSVPFSASDTDEGIILGTNEHQGVSSNVRFKPSDRLRHFYVIGQTGTGKTTCLKNMIIQDIKNGEGVCMIDPHGSDVEDILAHIPPERAGDLIYFDPGHTEHVLGLNMLEYDLNFPEQKTFVVNEMLSIFNKLFDMKTAGGPMFEQYFRNATMLVIEDPASGNTLLDISRVLSDKAFRDLKLSRCKNPLILQFWNEIANKAGGEGALENIVPYITSKFDVFLSNEIMRPIIAQEKSSLNFRDIMDNKKILLVNLSKGRLGDINSSLLGLILVGKILMSALSRVDSLGKDLPPFYLYIDEFQNVTTDSISIILSEARKYGLSLNIAHQFIAQLEEGIKDSVFGNVGSMAIFRTGSEDAEFLEKQLTPTFSSRDILNIPNYNSYVKLLVNGEPVSPFTMKNLTPEVGNTEVVEALKSLSYRRFGQKRELIEERIMNKYGLSLKTNKV